MVIYHIVWHIIWTLSKTLHFLKGGERSYVFQATVFFSCNFVFTPIKLLSFFKVKFRYNFSLWIYQPKFFWVPLKLLILYPSPLHMPPYIGNLFCAFLLGGGSVKVADITYQVIISVPYTKSPYSHFHFIDKKNEVTRSCNLLMAMTQMNKNAKALFATLVLFATLLLVCLQH